MTDYFVFVDESGDLGKLGTSYFIVAAIQVQDDKPLGRIIKRARERKLKKEMKELNELKGAKTTPEIRKFILGKIADLECKIFILAVEKKKILPGLMAAQNKLYNWLFRLLCQQVTGESISLVIDKKYKNIIQRHELEAYLEKQLSMRGITVSVSQLESHTSLQLQAVDFVAWAANRKFSHGDDSYYRIIEKKIANSGAVELWS